MGRLLTGYDYKYNGYSDAPLFQGWSSTNYYSAVSSLSDNLLINTSGQYHNPIAMYDSTGHTQQVRSDTIQHKDTQLALYIASTAENVNSGYCPIGFIMLKNAIGSTGRYIATIGNYANNYGSVNGFNALKVYNYQSGNMYRQNSNGTQTSLLISSFESECGLEIGSGYVIIPDLSPCLGIIVHAINYNNSNDNVWEFLYQDYPGGIYYNIRSNQHQSYVLSNCLYNLSYVDQVGNDIISSSSAYTKCWDKRLNNNSNEFPADYIFSLGDVILDGSYNLLAIEFIMSTLNIPSFGYYDSSNTYKTHNSETTSFSNALLTPGIGFHGSKKDTSGVQTFNVAPYTYLKGSYSEVVAIRKSSTSGTHAYVTGTRNIYSYFYPIPLIGGNSNNKFNPPNQLAKTNNEIWAIMHRYGNASNFDDL